MSLEEPGESGGGLADRRLVAILARYAARMGVSPALVWRAESLTPGTLHILSPAEIVALAARFDPVLTAARRGAAMPHHA